jgi:hypothetical protein
MSFLNDYHRQVALLIRTLPFVAAEPDFALKGGTAINLFVRNMPRLSVDIDLTYLISHDRPMAEVLAPSRKPLEAEFARGFEGMTRHPVALEELVAAREALVTAVVGEMPEAHRHFLLGFKRGEPDWTLLGLPVAADLPAVRWKQQNLAKLPQERRGKLIAALEAVFSVE